MERLNRLYLIRHGQVVDHEEYKVNGHTDVDITDVGREQMESMAERLQFTNIGAIYSSDLQRTKIGAQIIAKHHNVACKTLPEFREVYFGDWEGISFFRIQEEYPEELEMRKHDITNYRSPGGGENMLDLSKRVLPCLKRVLKEHNGRDILIVAHGAVNRVILCEALGLKLENIYRIKQDYGCLNIIDFFTDNTLIRLING